jgi:signal transduction histidine kinase
MFRSLQSRLWLSYLLLIAGVIGLALCGLLVYLVRNPAIQRQAALEIELAARSLEGADRFNTLRALLDRPGAAASTQVQDALERADNNLNVRILILNAATREVIADSRQIQAAEFPPQALRGLVAKEAPSLPRLVRDAGGVAWLYVLRPQGNDLLLMVAQPRPRATLQALLREDLVGPFVLAAAVAILLALFLGRWIARWTLSPLQRMTHEAHLVASGTNQPIPLEGPSEVQELAQSFNEMADRVQASQRSQRDFVANVSHDLKTPLTSIQGFAQAILDNAASNPDALQHAARVIYDESVRMHRMVMDLLDLARLDAGIASLERAPLNLAGLLSDLAARLEPQAHQAGIELKVSLSPEIQGLSGLFGDQDRLAQVSANLLDNALKFTPLTGQPAGQVSLAARLEGDHAVI